MKKTHEPTGLQYEQKVSMIIHENIALKNAVKNLFMLLDNIDTFDDEVKWNSEEFRRLAVNECWKRHEFYDLEKENIKEVSY
jgi:hypothetical protein